jgi:hypothetical protein
VDKTTRTSITKTLQVNICLGIGKYLGFPSMIVLGKGIKLNSLKIECRRRPSREGGKSLSKASKEVMIKVIHLLETYMINSFWWYNDGNKNKGVKWLSWDKLSMSKKDGYGGFRNSNTFNVALLE